MDGITLVYHKQLLNSKMGLSALLCGSQTPSPGAVALDSFKTTTATLSVRKRQKCH